LHFPKFPNLKPTSLFGAKAIIFFIVPASLLIAFVVWSTAKEYYQRQAKEQFHNHVVQVTDSIEKRMSRYSNVLQSGIGFFYGSEEVNRKEWHDFIGALEIKKNYPGMQGIGYAAMLSRDEVAPMEQRMRKGGYEDFALKPNGRLPFANTPVR
jgi:CHASE1-domain containing sensor protein